LGLRWLVRIGEISECYTGSISLFSNLSTSTFIII